MNKDEILNIITTGQQTDTVLNRINNPHAVSVMQYLSQLFASVAELLFNRLAIHRTEIETLVLADRWATPAWYVKMAKDFQYNFDLTTDELTQYYYDNDVYLQQGGTQSEIDASKRIKQAAVAFTGKRMIVKIAGEANGELCKINDEVAEAFRSYIEQIKRPGTPVTIYNFDADIIDIEYDIYFNGQLKEADVSLAVETAMYNYLSNVIFNGVFNTALLTDVLQKTKGVIDPFFVSAKARRSFDSATDAVDVTRYYSSYSGYIKYGVIKLNMKGV